MIAHKIVDQTGRSDWTTAVDQSSQSKGERKGDGARSRAAGNGRHVQRWGGVENCTWIKSVP
jgi:hypothetical protein